MTVDEAQALALEIRKTGVKLEYKDDKFVRSMEIKWCYSISDKQARWLQEIYARVTGGGSHERRQIIGRKVGKW